MSRDIPKRNTENRGEMEKSRETPRRNTENRGNGNVQ